MCVEIYAVDSDMEPSQEHAYLKEKAFETARKPEFQSRNLAG